MENFVTRTIRGGAAGKVICDAIKTAEITYLDQGGNVILTQPLGSVSPGGTIECKVPKPEDVSIVIG